MTFMGGISDIKSKRLNLLHSNSISDDPSRLIRCAKYASRLNFNISNNSLKQSQETVRQWPWKSSEIIENDLPSCTRHTNKDGTS